MRKRSIYRLILLIAVLLTSGKSWAQLTVSGAKTPTQLVEDVLLGTGVTASNITYTGHLVARGEFDALNSNIGFDAGVLLTSGSINNAIGPNNVGNRSRNNSQPGDADIDAIIAPTTSRDAAVLEFDFKPISDTIFFNYVFASEEYPEFAPPISSSFNDAFAFLLTGPNPAGGTYSGVNIALIPGTSTPVSINNINAVTNTAYYIANGDLTSGAQSSPNSPANINNVQFDAFTTPLTAIAAVVPCATYHIKLVVADALDFVWDSGVFLEANSFGSTVTNPTIDFVTTAPACDGDTVAFLNTGSTGPGIQFNWDFGSGAAPATSTLENPGGIVYNTPGLKLVKYSMDVNCGDTTMVLFKGITIDETPVPSFTSNAPQCANQSVNFVYSGTLGSNWTYLWDFGSGANPSTSSAQNPSGVRYNISGSKTVTLTVRNGNCIETITQNIVINARPSAAFSSNAPVGTGYSVNFTNGGTTGASYAWTFGAASSPGTSTAENPTGITYSSDGSKAITLITSSSGCADTTTGYINIITTPTPSFTSNAPQAVGFPILFTYTGNTGSNFTYTWDFGSGAVPSSSTSKNPPAVFYSTSGTKTITLTVKNGSVSIVYTQVIVIDNPPQSSFTSSAPNCEGTGIDFQSSGSASATYSWNFGSGASPATSTAQNPIGVVYNTSGFKTVQLISTLNGSNDTNTSVIYIVKQPQVNFTHNGPQCEGAPIDLNYSGNAGTNWSFTWDLGSSASPALSSSVNPQGITYSSPGNKIITLSVSNAMCADVDTQIITINPTPVADFASTAPSCTNDSVVFANSGSVGMSYDWQFGSGSSPSSSSSENNIVTYSSAGIKTIRQVVAQGSCSDTAFSTVNIIERPQPNFTHNAPQCEGSEVAFNYSGTNSAGWTFLWDFGLNAVPALSAATSSQNVKYQSDGGKTITLTVSNGMCSEMTVQSLNINPTPSAGFTSTAPSCTGDSISFNNTGTTGISYNWDFGTGSSPTTSTDELPTGITYSSRGIKTIRQISTLGTCIDTSLSTINITERPQPSFTNMDTVCQGTEVAFNYSGSSGSGWTYIWDFGGASNPNKSAAINPPDVGYRNAGSKNISLTVTNKFCSETVMGNVVIDTTPVASIVTSSPVCTGDSLQLGVNGLQSGNPNFSYQWSFSGTPVFDPNTWKAVYSSSGIKQISLVLGIGNCFDSTQTSVVINQSPVASFSSTAPVCQGEAVDFLNTGSSGSRWRYQWDFGSQAFPSISTQESPSNIKFKAPGKHKILLRVRDVYCSTSDSLIVDVFSLPNAEAGIDTIICADDCMPIGALPETGFTYKWFPSMGLNDPTSANPIACPSAEFTQYIVTVSNDTTGCLVSDTLSITMLSSAFADAGRDVEICIGDSIQIGTSIREGQSYSWIPVDGLSDAGISSPLASPEETTNYKISVSYKECAVITDEIKVVVRRAIANAGEDVTIAKGESVELNASGGVQYEWTPFENLTNVNIPNPVANPEETTTYIVFVVDAFNCEDNDSVLVSVVNPEIFLPTAFTPNGSGRNDVFRVRGNPLTDFEMTVFNRNGEVIYFSKDFYSGWNGNSQITGEPLSKGAYVYNVRGIDESGEEVALSGVINLIR